jgi:cytochrome c oxidase accessory protein FixG
MNDTAARPAAAQAPVETIDVAPVNAREKRSLYAKRPRIHPKRAEGRFRRAKWAIMAATLAIYYLTPWIRWDRGASAPDQAVLIDFSAQRFYFFFIEIWPQEFYYVTGLLILAALTLFLMTAIAGRVWCGYLCPQTVWTDLFLVVERAIEGDRNARIRLDRAKWTASKIGRKLAKHAIWLAIALATGGAWVFYFADAPALAADLVRLDAAPVAYISIAVLTATTYLLGGLAREQVCTYMCPWPRIQGAMLDEHSLVVSYHPDRGEPRGAHKQGDPWEGRGHCIDCNQCVAVCPMGIDIREGQQLECITCALCIDACDGVMDRVGLPRGLISYDTLARMDSRAKGETPKLRIVRPRTILYAALIAVVGLVMLFTLVSRPQLELSVLADRNPLYVTLSDGSVRNGYTVKVLNKVHEDRQFRLAVAGLAGAAVQVIGQRDAAAPTLDVPADSLRSFRLFVTAPRASVAGGSAPLVVTLTDTSDGTEAATGTVFRGPGR